MAIDGDDDAPGTAPDDEPNEDDFPEGASYEVVPSAFTHALERIERMPLRAHSFDTLKNQQVVVDAGGFSYRGMLIGADEDDLYLRGETRWWVLPLDRIRDVRVAPREVPCGTPIPGFSSQPSGAPVELDDDDAPVVLGTAHLALSELEPEGLASEPPRAPIDDDVAKPEGVEPAERRVDVTHPDGPPEHDA